MIIIFFYLVYCMKYVTTIFLFWMQKAKKIRIRNTSKIYVPVNRMTCCPTMTPLLVPSKQDLQVGILKKKIFFELFAITKLILTT